MKRVFWIVVLLVFTVAAGFGGRETSIVGLSDVELARIWLRTELDRLQNADTDELSPTDQELKRRLPEDADSTDLKVLIWRISHERGEAWRNARRDPVESGNKSWSKLVAGNKIADEYLKAHESDWIDRCLNRKLSKGEAKALITETRSVSKMVQDALALGPPISSTHAPPIDSMKILSLARVCSCRVVALSQLGVSARATGEGVDLASLLAQIQPRYGLMGLLETMIGIDIFMRAMMNVEELTATQMQEIVDAIDLASIDLRQTCRLRLHEMRNQEVPFDADMVRKDELNGVWLRSLWWDASGSYFFDPTPEHHLLNAGEIIDKNWREFLSRVRRIEHLSEWLESEEPNLFVASDWRQGYPKLNGLATYREFQYYAETVAARTALQIRAAWLSGKRDAEFRTSAQAIAVESNLVVRFTENGFELDFVRGHSLRDEREYPLCTIDTTSWKDSFAFAR